MRVSNTAINRLLVLLIAAFHAFFDGANIAACGFSILISVKAFGLPVWSIDFRSYKLCGH